MYFWSILASILLVIVALFGCQKPKANAFLEEYLWTNRVLIVFSADEADERAQKQLAPFFNATTLELSNQAKERAMTVIQLSHNNDAVRVDGARIPRLFSTPFYKHYGVERDAFTVKLIGKDGTVKMTENQPVEAHVIYDLIDSMPMRQREMNAQ